MKVKISGSDYVPILSGPVTVNLTLRSQVPGTACIYVGANLVADTALPHTLEKLFVPAGFGLSVKASVETEAEYTLSGGK
jgi:hypothetical protein